MEEHGSLSIRRRLEKPSGDRNYFESVHIEENPLSVVGQKTKAVRVNGDSSYPFPPPGKAKRQNCAFWVSINHR